MEANSDLIIKSLPSVRALQRGTLPSEPQFWGAQVGDPYDQGRGGGSRQRNEKGGGLSEKGLRQRGPQALPAHNSRLLWTHEPISSPGPAGRGAEAVLG